MTRHYTREVKHFCTSNVRVRVGSAAMAKLSGSHASRFFFKTIKTCKDNTSSITRSRQKIMEEFEKLKKR